MSVQSCQSWRGFSLVELLITLTILAIVMNYAIAAWHELLARSLDTQGRVSPLAGRALRGLRGLRLKKHGENLCWPNKRGCDAQRAGLPLADPAPVAAPVAVEKVAVLIKRLVVEELVEPVAGVVPLDVVSEHRQFEPGDRRQQLPVGWGIARQVCVALAVACFWIGQGSMADDFPVNHLIFGCRERCDRFG